MNEEGFWFAVVAPGRAETRVRFEHHGEDRDPDDYLDLRHTPRNRDFDEFTAEAQVADHGYEMTSGWQWGIGDEWVAVVQWKD